MKRILLISIAAVALCGCLKDEVVIEDLTTNALDPDYDGPPFIELVSDTTQVVFFQGQPVDTIVMQVVQVRTDLLPPGTFWDWYITKDNTGEVIDDASDIPQPDPVYHHAEVGTSYCWSYQLKVQYSLTKTYRFCTTAAL